jgi:hypothetical protein
MATKRDEFTKDWIIENSIEIVDRYEPGILTIRGLHYQLVSIGMTNDIAHYKRVVTAMIQARWDKTIDFEAFSDHDRVMIGKTDSETTAVNDKIEDAKDSIKFWMNYYRKNRWENQLYYPEVFIEKKALQGVFDRPCKSLSVALGACKGYPSLTFLNDTAKRFIEAEQQGKIPIILYFGDYDPSGEDIPRSIQENIIKLGCENIEVRRIALMEEQVVEWKLPPAPIKEGDSRSAAWNGLGQVELDAMNPKVLQNLCTNAIMSVFDKKLYSELKEVEETESVEYRLQLKQFMIDMKDDDETSEDDSEDYNDNDENDEDDDY